MTQLLGVAPVLPEARYAQEDVTDALVRIIGLDERSERVMRRIHASCGVDGRHLALPLDAYDRITDFTAANDAFITAAVDLGSRALSDALDRAGLAPHDVDVIICVTTTGMAVPSLEARIAERLGLRTDVVRIPVVGLGCMAGAAGTARLRDVLAGRPDGVAALVSVELCSLTIQRGDASGANLVASGLFGDGGGALVAVGPGHPPVAGAVRVVDAASRLYPGTGAVMGWDVGTSGLRVVLGAEVPDLVREHVGGDVAAFLARHDLTIADVDWWVCHPGGPKVIDALAATLGVPDDALALTRTSLRTVGNISSASVIHILRDALDRRPAPGTHGLMMAMGPGFALELVLLEAQ